MKLAPQRKERQHADASASRSRMADTNIRSWRAYLRSERLHRRMHMVEAGLGFCGFIMLLAIVFFAGLRSVPRAFDDARIGVAVIIIVATVGLAYNSRRNCQHLAPVVV